MMQVFSAPVDSDNATTNTIINSKTTTTITTSKTRFRYIGEDTSILQTCLALLFIVLFLICVFRYCKKKN